MTHAFAPWIQNGSLAAALVMRQPLSPVDGPDGVFFPPTFAKAEERDGFKGGYNIDTAPDGTNVCMIDSVGSQANRIEPIFKLEPYSALVPQVEVVVGDMIINLLDAGHRAGDAIVRCSALEDRLKSAFQALAKGNAEPLARLAPTSLVFGVWDSRGTQAKAPRLLSSTIRAFDVKPLTRSAQYTPPIRYVEAGLIEDTNDKAVKDQYSVRGFLEVPASGTHGGVIAREVRRDAQLHLAALRLLGVPGDPARTEALRRYVLGLALTAFTAPVASYLRQGCNLVQASVASTPIQLVMATGERTELSLSHGDALAFAGESARAFGVGESVRVPFEKARAETDLADAKAKKDKKAGKPK
jgi:CRISPR-associated protein Csb1